MAAAAGAVGPSLPEVVDVAVGDGHAALEARVTSDIELSSAASASGSASSVGEDGLADSGQEGEDRHVVRRPGLA